MFKWRSFEYESFRTHKSATWNLKWHSFEYESIRTRKSATWSGALLSTKVFVLERVPLEAKIAQVAPFRVRNDSSVFFTSFTGEKKTSNQLFSSKFQFLFRQETHSLPDMKFQRYYKCTSRNLNTNLFNTTAAPFRYLLFIIIRFSHF